MADDTAHRAALGAALLTGYADMLADRLTADDFEPGWLQLVYVAITEIHAQGRTVDSLAVLTHLQASGRVPRDGKFGVFIAELYEAATFPPEPERHVAAVIEHSYRRQLWAATTRIRQAVTEWPLEAVRATVDRELTGAMQAAGRLTPAKAEKRQEHGLPGLAGLIGSFTGSPAA